MNRRSDVWKMTQSASIWGLHVSHECVCNTHLRADSLSVQFYRENTWRLISTTSSVQWAAPQSHPAPDKLPCRGEQGRPRCSHRPAWRWGDLHLWLPRWPPVDCLTDRHKHNYKTVHVFHAWAGLRWSLCHQHLHIWIVHDVVAKRDFQCFHVCCSRLCWCRLQSAGVTNGLYGKSRNDLSCSFTHSSVVNLWFFSWLCESLSFPSTRAHRSCVNVQLNVLLHLSRLCVDAAWLSVFPHQRRNWVFLCFRVVFGAFHGSFYASVVLLRLTLNTCFVCV